MTSPAIHQTTEANPATSISWRRTVELHGGASHLLGALRKTQDRLLRMGASLIKTTLADSTLDTFKSDVITITATSLLKQPSNTQ